MARVGAAAGFPERHAGTTAGAGQLPEGEAAGLRDERRLRLRIGREGRRIFAGVVPRATAAGGNQLRFRCVPATPEESTGTQVGGTSCRGSAGDAGSDGGRRYGNWGRFAV